VKKHPPPPETVSPFSPLEPELPAKLEKMNVMNMEMEASALFVLSHLAGFRAMLYSRAVTLHVLDWIRRERRFRSGRALARQIHRDLAKTHLLK